MSSGYTHRQEAGQKQESCRHRYGFFGLPVDQEYQRQAEEAANSCRPTFCGYMTMAVTGLAFLALFGASCSIRGERERREVLPIVHPTTLESTEYPK